MQVKTLKNNFKMINEQFNENAKDQAKSTAQQLRKIILITCYSKGHNKL